jgi:pre-mRNA-processing factor 19
VPEDWATADIIQSFQPSKLASGASGSRSLAIDSTGDKLLQAGPKNTVQVVSLSKKAVTESLEPQAGEISTVAWNGETAVVATATGAVKLYQGENEIASFDQHAGAANALSVHPSGALVASVGVDKSFIFYDVTNSSVVTQVFTNSSTFYEPLLLYYY